MNTFTIPLSLFLVSTVLTCPLVDIVNHTKLPWNLKDDQRTLEYNVKAQRCSAHFKNEPCLVRIHKLGVRDYHAECGPVRSIASNKITYTKDIKPLFSKRCAMCHSAGDLNWMDYNTAFIKKDLIYYRVVKMKNMPPPGLPFTDAERKLVGDWIDGGAKK